MTRSLPFNYGLILLTLTKLGIPVLNHLIVWTILYESGSSEVFKDFHVNKLRQK